MREAPRNQSRYDEAVMDIDISEAWALIVLELDGGRISGWCSFLDTGKLFRCSGSP